MKNIVDFNYVNAKDKKLCDAFMHSNNIKKYILGINKFTKSVLKNMEVDGVIDDFTRVQRSRKKTILKIEDVPKDSIILSVSTGSPLEVKKYLDENDYTHINYLALYKYSDLDLDLDSPIFMGDFEDDYKKNYSKYVEVYNQLSDQKSKDIFTKVLNFKISYDLDFMSGFTNDHSSQYFDNDILPKFKNINFVDGGGYIGDTAKILIDNYSDFNKIYLIEPIESNLKIAKRELAKYDNIEFINFGLHSKKMTLNFNEDKSFSSIYGSGTNFVELNSLDTLIKDKVDYIKLDIEGAELDAIDGAKRLIERDKPTLAICVYHKAEDWYKVPQKVLEINPNYKIYFRHYMEGIYESVMYFTL